MPIRARTVLVVEDDRAIRYLFTEVLRGAGYEVIACENGTLGLEQARSRIGGIDAVITDSTMPGLDSREMIDAIRAIRPEIPVVIVSGSMEDGTARAGGDPGTLFLTKPLSPERLMMELQRLLAPAP
jgi:CheY-like chemotaxis protein